MDFKEYNGSIQKRLISIILSITSIVILFGYSIFVTWYIDNQQTRNIELSKTISNILSQDLAKLVLLNDVSSASDITSKLKAFPTVTSLVLFNNNKKAIYQYSQDNKEVKSTPIFNKNQIIKSKRNLKIYTSVKYMGNPLGYLELNIKIETLYCILKDSILSLLTLMILMIIFSYILSVRNAKQFTKPIIKLVKSLESLHFDKPVTTRLEYTQKDEFGKLYDEVNLMLNRIDNFINFKKIASVAFETQSGMIITDKDIKILQPGFTS